MNFRFLLLSLVKQLQWSSFSGALNGGLPNNSLCRLLDCFVYWSNTTGYTNTQWVMLSAFIVTRCYIALWVDKSTRLANVAPAIFSRKEPLTPPTSWAKGSTYFVVQALFPTADRQKFEVQISNVSFHTAESYRSHSPILPFTLPCSSCVVVRTMRTKRRQTFFCLSRLWTEFSTHTWFSVQF